MNAAALFQAVAMVVTSMFVAPTTSETVPTALRDDTETTGACLVDVSADRLESLEYRAPETSRTVNPVSARADGSSDGVTLYRTDFSRGGTF